MSSSGTEDDPQYPLCDSDLDQFLSVALKLSGEVGDMIRDAIGKQQRVSVEHKTGGTFTGEGMSSSVLTETDTAVEKHLVSGFSKVSNPNLFFFLSSIFPKLILFHVVLGLP